LNLPSYRRPELSSPSFSVPKSTNHGLYRSSPSHVAVVELRHRTPKAERNGSHVASSTSWDPFLAPDSLDLTVDSWYYYFFLEYYCSHLPVLLFFVLSKPVVVDSPTNLLYHPALRTPTSVLELHAASRGWIVQSVLSLASTDSACTFYFPSFFARLAPWEKKKRYFRCRVCG
jgi:hypothetical protein